MRTIAIGDIHGCALALRTLINAIAPTPEDTLVFLGDYVDRGPESRDVIDQIIALKEQCKVIALRGNHEIMFMGAVVGGMEPEMWLRCGGLATIGSYQDAIENIPSTHLQFLTELLPFHETETTIFVHANYLHDIEMAEQPEQYLYWEHLGTSAPAPHQSGKRVVVGHSAQPSGRVLDAGHMICIDTYCFGGRWLTAMDVDQQTIWQANQEGKLRGEPEPSRLQRFKAWWGERYAERRLRSPSSAPE